MEIPVMQRASQYKHGFNKDNNKDARTMQQKYKTTTCHRGKMTAVLCLVILCNVTVASSCPSHCSCSEESTAFCNNKHFTSSPTDFTSVVERLYLFNNNISSISPRSLQPLKNLKLLDLSGNRISNYALWKGIFTQLKLLENLMLQENQISRITKDMFSGLTNLARIYLQDNQITYIEEGAFNKLPNLVELKLRNNRLTSFPRIRDTPNLLLLDLGFNQLRTIRDLALSTVNLEYLRLQSNKLTELRTSVFDDTSRLTQLDISNNRLTAVPLVIKSLTSLRALNMSRNKVGTIPVDTFRGMLRLKNLYLQDMGLKSLPFGMIPPRAILNVLDISDNDWDCKCSMHWLPQYISIFEIAVVRPDEVKCSTPLRLRDRRVKDLSDDDFECTEEELAQTLHPTTKTTTTMPITPTTVTRTPWVADPCDVYRCFNGGTCYKAGLLPKCRCARRWHGLQCQKSRFPATTRTTTTTSRPRVTESKRIHPSQKAELLINEESITKDSVEIILPQTETELVISVSEIGQDKKPTELTIKPVAHPFTVKGLESGKFYNICVHLPLLGRNDRLPPYLDSTDTLCGSVKTNGIRVINTPVVTTKITVVPSPGVTNGDLSPIDKTRKDDKSIGPNVPGHGDKQQGNRNPDASPTESTDFKIIYPAVGAGIGAVIIVGGVIMLFVCYRKKRMEKLKNQGPGDYIPGSPVDGTQMVDMEMATVVHHHHHNHYNAGGVEANSRPKTASKKQNIPYKKQKNQPSSFINNNSAPKSASPIKTSSLGRSSNSSSNSSNGTLQSRYVDSPSHYPPQQQQYISSGIPNHPQYDGMPPQRNGRGSEYIYRNHQNNNNSAMQVASGRYMPMGRPYDPELMEEMQPLTGGVNQLPYIPGEGPMYQEAYPMSPREYIPPAGPISYPQNNSRSAFQPIQGPRKNTVGTPTSESGPITTHVNTAHVLPTSTCLNRNLMSENLSRYPDGVPVV